MKKINYLSYVAFLFLITLNALAQKEVDTTVDLDMLAVPNSPAFSLLGVNPSEVDKPSTPSDFAFSIANASNNLSQLPRNYAIEFLPVSFFSRCKSSYSKFTNDPDSVDSVWKKLGNNISQSFTFSAGFASDENADTSVQEFIRTRSGIGFKFSLFRGKMDTAFIDYKNSILKVREKLKLLHNENEKRLEAFRKTNRDYLSLFAQRDSIIQQLISLQRNTELRSEEKDSLKDSLLKQMNSINVMKDVLEDEFKKRIAKEEKDIVDAAKVLKNQVEQIKFKRYGFLLDVAGGLVLGFRNDNFQNSVVQQYAVWMNGGYSCKKGFSFLGLARHSTSIDSKMDENGILSNENIWDIGCKIEFQTNDDKFSLNGETVARIFTDTTVYRFTINTSYQVGKNQALTFSVGKAFAGTTQYRGNLIAALNYIRSFGSDRRIVPNGTE